MLKLFQGCFRLMLSILYKEFQFGLGLCLAGYGTGAVMAVPCGDKEIMLLLTFKDKMECEIKIFSNVDISKQLRF
jgi:hypothetical protein